MAKCDMRTLVASIVLIAFVIFDGEGTVLYPLKTRSVPRPDLHNPATKEPIFQAHFEAASVTGCEFPAPTEQYVVRRTEPLPLLSEHISATVLYRGPPCDKG